jgi:hypothetical protein
VTKNVTSTPILTEFFASSTVPAIIAHTGGMASVGNHSSISVPPFGPAANWIDGGAVIADTLGLIGFTLLLAAFGLNAVGKMERASTTYDAMNFVGAGILSWYAMTRDTPIFVVLELCWAAIALGSLARRLTRQRAQAHATRT